ncbi:MAG: tRNA (N(6)-L-threonylcarbamoyladenosine(37)-C(2))-methylthiotransferase [Candidatus Marsarchaeota archaeon]|nr:tRNA (N(6)-L-threonylcarbamoyladenosine(37)-C(2))-methylthiotransferase [Candidatus Marsarchaeota archaeon]
MANVLNEAGISIAKSEGEADVIVVNTCTVKTPTEQKILNAIEKLEKKGKKIVVSGCMASANQDLIERHAGHASIITTSNIDMIDEAVLDAYDGKRVIFDDYVRKDKLSLFRDSDSIIAKVPVSEGCLSNCGFCGTKFSRGPLNSFSEDLVVNAVAISARRGAREIQLTSQDIGAYGLDRRTNIAMLMDRLAKIEGDFKIRIGMLNPEHLGKYLEGFINALQSDRFYKFVHIPVQSGSDKVLNEMKRAYSIEQFDDHVAKIRDVIPDATIETDVIVGYPTETEEDFEKTLEFIKRTKPNVVNMCKFWARPHTAASKLTQLPNSVITKRSARFARVVRQTQQSINDAFVGNVLTALVTEMDERSFAARADNYKKIIIKRGASNVSLGSTVNVRIGSASCNVLYGIPIEATQ